MTDKARLKALAHIADLKKEADLVALARATAERTKISACIAALDGAATAARQTTASDMAALAAQEGFGRLAAAQRSGLEMQLAQATGIWRARRDAAALSFGRSQVLDRLRDRMAARTEKQRGGDPF